MKDLKESILDSEEVVMKDLDRLIRVREFYSKVRSKTPKEIDMIGRPLEIGDLVIAPNRGKPMPGVIMKIHNGNFAVCFTGIPEDMSRDASHEFRTNICGYEIIKIDENILKSILK